MKLIEMLEKKFPEVKMGLKLYRGCYTAESGKLASKIEENKMSHNVVRVIGQWKRIFHGTERHDKLKLNETQLKGFIRVVKQNGEITETTRFGKQEIKGVNWVWLAKRNCRTVKANMPPVEYVKLPPNQVFVKTEAGELTTKQALSLL